MNQDKKDFALLKEKIKIWKEKKAKGEIGATIFSQNMVAWIVRDVKLARGIKLIKKMEKNKAKANQMIKDYTSVMA